MTEAEWLAATDPAPMLSFVSRRKAGERKLRLFTVACCRQLWQYLDDDKGRPALEAAEQCADGHLTDRELWDSWGQIGLDNHLSHRIAIRNGFCHEVVHAALMEVGISMSVMNCPLAQNTARRVANIVGGQALGSRAEAYMLHLLGKDV